jgi:hypothetical protein
MRPKENTTSSAVKSLPSWNFTPFLRLKRHCVSDTCFQLVARQGSAWYFVL